MGKKKINTVSTEQLKMCEDVFVKTHEHQICIFRRYLRQKFHRDPLRRMGFMPKYECRALNINMKFFKSLTEEKSRRFYGLKMSINPAF